MKHFGHRLTTGKVVAEQGRTIVATLELNRLLLLRGCLKMWDFTLIFYGIFMLIFVPPLPTMHYCCCYSRCYSGSLDLAVVERRQALLWQLTHYYPHSRWLPPKLRHKKRAAAEVTREPTELREFFKD
jgi:hypothetical protein